MKTREEMARDRERQRWDKMTPGERTVVLLKKIDLNTRAIAKVGSMVDYLTSEEDTVVVHRKGPAIEKAPPELLVALRTLLRERRPLRYAQERELAESRRLKAAREAMAVGRDDV